MLLFWQIQGSSTKIKINRESLSSE